MTSHYDKRELGDLLHALAEQQLDAEGERRLESLLREHQEARTDYLCWSARESLLFWDYREAQSDVELLGEESEDESQGSGFGSQESVGHAMRDGNETNSPARGACPTPRPKSLLNWASRHPKGPAIAIAATLLIAALVVMGLVPVKDWMAGGGKTSGDEETQEKKDEEFVAKLSNWQNDVWLEDTRPPRDDPRLNVGRRLKIESGLIEVTYLTGARVVIEGPAEFVVGGTEAAGTKAQATEPAERLARREGEGGSLDAANAGFLRLGRLVARVEGKKAQGFTIATPAGEFEDLGTEFGVEVSEDRVASLHVFTGRVVAKVFAEDGAVRQRTELAAGNGLRIDPRAGTVANIESARDRFVAELDSSRLGSQLAVDFNAGDSPTQVGFLPVTRAGVKGVVTDLGTLDISFSGLSRIGSYRDRGPLTDGSVMPQSNMLRDFVYGSSEYADSLDIKIAGLEVGTYEFTAYFHDVTANQGTATVQVSANGGIEFTVVSNKVRVSTGATPAAIGQSAFRFTTDGTDHVVVRIASNMDGEFASQTPPIGVQLINGFVITKVANELNEKEDTSQ